MSIELDPIVNTNTFGVWKDRTNQIIDALEDVVTIGGATDNKVGNITIRGDITSTGNLVVDTVNTTGADTQLFLNSSVKTTDEVTIGNGGDGEGKITFLDDESITWKIHTSSDHDHIDFIRNEKYMRIDYSDSLITGSGLTISGDILPTTDAIDEGIINQYFTEAKARSAISVDPNGDLTYDSTTGVLSVDLPVVPEYGVTSSKALKRTAVGDNYTFGVNFDNDTIKINSANELYVTVSGVVDNLNASTGVTIDDQGNVSIGQDVATTSEVTFAKVTATELDISSDLTVDEDGNIDGANASFSQISGSTCAGDWIATEAEAKAGTASDKIMTPERVKDAIDQFAIPKWAGTTTLANVKTTYQNAPVGTRVAFFDERTSLNYSFGTGNGGSHTITVPDRYRVVYVLVQKIENPDGSIANVWSLGA